ncbi:2718_t:CDS:1, partial [Dentiscutata heterogama]
MTNQEQESITNQFSSNDIIDDQDTCESEDEYISEESVTSVLKPALSFAN